MSPVRTCVACRQPGEREDLVRLCAVAGEGVVVDLRARLPGRGAWVHPRRECVEGLAAKPGPLERALGTSDGAAELPSRLREAVTRAVLDGLSIAAAGGGIVGGSTLLTRALRAGEVSDLVFASDVAVRTRDDLVALAGADVPSVEIPLSKVDLGARVGQDHRAALGVLSVSASNHVRRQLRRLRQLG